MESITKHLRGIRCPSISWDRGHAILSCPDAIAGVLDRHQIRDTVEVRHKANPGAKQETNPKASGEIGNMTGQCPDCGGLLIFQEGCFICPACGYTKC
jgi:ribonucleoside-diphosphate reductase alpha chain